MNPKSSIYTCGECHAGITATGDDPVCMTRLGTHHYGCMRQAWARHAREQVEKEKRKEDGRAEKSERMRELGRQRMADPAARAAAAERLAAGRKAKRQEGKNATLPLFE